MTPEIPLLLLILKGACEAFGYRWRLIDHHSKNLAEVSDGRKSFFASNSRPGVYPLNPNFSTQLAKDKAWTSSLLVENGYRIPQGDYFFLRPEHRDLRSGGRELEDALALAEKIGYPVFVKPNSLSLGALAEAVYSQKELEAHLEAIAQRDYIALIQEKIEQPEYRLFVVDGEVQFMYQKSAPQMTGDGTTTVRQFIERANQTIDRVSNQLSVDSFFLQNQLRDHRLTLDSPVPAGLTVGLTSKNNITAGGCISDYTESVLPSVGKWAKKVAETMRLRVCGIDVFAQSVNSPPEDFIIIEVNGNPNLAGIYKHGKKEKALEIWHKIMQKYFEG